MPIDPLSVHLLDTVRDMVADCSGRIRGFYREAGPKEAGKHGRLLVACAPFHPDLCLLHISPGSRAHLRPLEAGWTGRLAGFTEAESVADARYAARYYGDICETHLTSLVDTGPESVLGRFPPLTAHERLQVQDWRAGTRRRIAASGLPGLARIST